MYPQEVNIPHDVIPESKVLHSRNNISMKSVVRKEGVEPDFKIHFLNVWYSIHWSTSPCVEGVACESSRPLTTVVTWTIFSPWEANSKFIRNFPHWNFSLLPILLCLRSRAYGVEQVPWRQVHRSLYWLDAHCVPMAVLTRMLISPKWCRGAHLVKN